MRCRRGLHDTTAIQIKNTSLFHIMIISTLFEILNLTKINKYLGIENINQLFLKNQQMNKSFSSCIFFYSFYIKVLSSFALVFFFLWEQDRTSNFY